MTKERLFHILTIVALSMGSFCLIWMFNANATMKLLSHKLDAIIDNTQVNDKQNDTLEKHWKINSWSKQQINALRAIHGLEILNWDLD